MSNPNTLKLNNGTPGPYTPPVPEYAPDFGANPTQTAVRRGPWENPHVWSGVILKGDKAKVEIAADVEVTLNSINLQTYSTVELEEQGPQNQTGGQLTFSDQVDTRLNVRQAVAREGSELKIDLEPAVSLTQVEPRPPWETE